MQGRSLAEVAEGLDRKQIELALAKIESKLKKSPDQSWKLHIASIYKLLEDTQFDENKLYGTFLLFKKFKQIKEVLEEKKSSDNDIINTFKKYFNKLFHNVQSDEFEKYIEGLSTTDFKIEPKVKKGTGRYKKVFIKALGRAVEKRLTAPQEDEEENEKFLFPFHENTSFKFYSNAYDYIQAPLFSNTSSSSHLPSSSSVSQSSNLNPRVNSSKGVFPDMFNDMNNARDYIFIVGWALSPTEKFGVKQQTLPEVIAKQALEGKKIVLLIWRNFTPEFSEEIKLLDASIRNEIEKLKGFYSIPQYQDAFNNYKIEFSVTAKFTTSHHQKMVVIDDILYVGGLDLTIGRSDPDTWHDCHARVTGPVVEDAIALIKARWETIDNEQRKKEGLEILTKAYTKIKAKKPLATNSSDSNNQPLMRLICTLNSEHANIKSINDSNQNRVTDIHRTYCEAIARAENFIYIENQFFVGTRFKGQTIQENGNQIVRAILNKIKEKANNNEPFHFYCQLPYRPEGGESDFHVQTVLRKQWTTMAWLISEVQKVIPKDKTVADYITFYNLGHNDADDKYQMKYTHSKLLIVDDKELIVGSANCNARSMTGKKDSEVAIHILGTGSDTVDKIKNYRCDLMREHFGSPPSLDPATDYKQIQTTLQINLYNLKNPSARFKPYATPWGNIPLAELYKNQKPGHVPDQSPQTGSIVDKMFKLSG